MAGKKKSVRKIFRSYDYYDYNLLAVIVLLTAFGLVILYSTSCYTAQIVQKDDMYFLKRQGLFAVAAIIMMILVSLVDYHKLMYLAFVIYAMALVLMIAVKYSPLGATINGARRWLKIPGTGMTIQPSEIAKIAVIIFISLLIVKMGRRYRGVKPVILTMAFGIVQAGITYYCTDNLSTAIIIFMITAAIVFVAHPKTVPFLVLIGIGVLFIVAFILYVPHLAAGDSFRIQRVLVWLNPEQYSDSGGYQIMQALYALGSGGLFGKGLGNSTQKLGSLPEAQNDMIFSIVCEELGVFGGLLLLLLFGFLLYRLFFIAQNAPDLFGSLMVTGIFSHVALQVILNICVVCNVIPTTGVTLPFVSYGGTSLFFLMAEMAIALSVSHQIKFKQDAV
ncbi:MAG: cell division protein FtsW [Lachnospiraceae bacterium]|nr:cell division protein FtsW [Candidatus Equihabitans merdae]